MTTKLEIDTIFQIFTKYKRLENLIVYNCTSGYPVPFRDVCLLEIKNLKKYLIKPCETWVFRASFRYRSRHWGIYTWRSFIERHFTFDRTWKGTDHSASLEPEGLKT